MPPVYDAPEDPRKRLNQGDVFEEVAFVARTAADVDFSSVPARGLLISHDCDCDKFEEAEKQGMAQERLETWPVSVAPLEPIRNLGDGNAGHARGGRMPRYFWLPEEEDLGEMIADLWRIQPIPWMELANCKREASLSAIWKERLWIHLWQLQTRLPAEEVFREDRFEEGVLHAP